MGQLNVYYQFWCLVHGMGTVLVLILNTFYKSISIIKWRRSRYFYVRSYGIDIGL